jgi:uncharacterized NAD-dependent epimerase/dehydratase family protein
MVIDPPYLIFLGDVPDALAAKTGLGIVDWRPEWCIGQLRLDGCQADANIPDLSIEEAVAQGVKTMVVGAVNAGGVLPGHWIASIVAALDAGLDVATGLHVRLASIDEIRDAAARSGAKLHDVRFSDQRFDTGKGTKRSGLRCLTVGTDCSVGKKYTALALEREMRGRGMKADFRATGQTGVFISGRGAAIDAVAADFISGAVEWIAPLPIRITGIWSRGRARCFTRVLPACRSAFSTAHRQMPSLSVTSRPGRPCAASSMACRASAR